VNEAPLKRNGVHPAMLGEAGNACKGNAREVHNLLDNMEHLKMVARAFFTVAITAATYFFASASSAQWSYTEEFEADPTCGEGQWLHRFEQNDGGIQSYSQGDYCMIPDRVPQDAGSVEGDGQYMNFYTNYGDAALHKLNAMKNLGGFGVPAGGGYAGNAGDHIFSACVYVPPTSSNGAEFDRNVDVGMCLKGSGNSYGEWPGDAVDQCTTSRSFASLPRGSWNRVGVTFTAGTWNRVDAGFYITHDRLDSYLVANGGQYDRYPHTAVYIDEMYVGLAQDAPTACGSVGDGDNDGSRGANPIPVMPLGGIALLVSLVALLGLRRRRQPL